MENIIMIRNTLLFILTMAVSLMSSSEPLKKIKVTETNNSTYFINSNNFIYKQLDSQYLGDLKEYVIKQGFKIKEIDEVQFVQQALKWTNEQWDHDGMNESPKGSTALSILKNVYEKKQKYRCVEFGLVLADVLQSYGFVTRSVSLRAPDVAYSGLGGGHVATEVRVNDLNKWVFLDAQFGIFVTRKNENTILNYSEIYQEKKSGHWEDLAVHFVNEKDQDEKNSKAYKDFLKKYFGSMSTSADVNSPSISLQLESKDWPLTFQGLSTRDLVYTDDVKQFYPEINRATLLLSYFEKEKNFSELFKKLNIQNNEDYLKNRAFFAAQPKFIVKLLNNMPRFDHYEYRLDDSKKWTKLTKASFKWDALQSKNRLEVKAVNKLGRSGPVTWMNITYE